MKTTFLIKQKYLVIADQLLFSGGNFLSTLLLARILNPTDFGVYSALILHGFLLLSLGNALCIQPFQVSPIKRRRSAIYTGFLFYLQLAFVLLALLTSWFLASLNGLGAYLSLHALFLLGGLLMHDFARKYLLGLQMIWFVLAIDFTVSVTQVLILLASYLQPGEPTLALLLFGSAYLPAIVVFVFWLKPSIRYARLWPGLFMTQLRQSGWYSLVALVQWGSANLFVVSAGLFINIETLGAFRLIQSLFGVLNVLFQSFENYVLPAASRLYQESAELSRSYLRKTGRRGILLIGLVLLILFVFAEQVLFLASGPKYLAYAGVLRGMCVLYLVLFICYPIRLGIRVLLMNRDFFTGYLLSFLFSLAFFNFFIRQWLLPGVVAGLILSQLIMLLFWSYRLHQKTFYLWK